jgi:hypothetical protein
MAMSVLTLALTMTPDSASHEPSCFWFKRLRGTLFVVNRVCVDEPLSRNGRAQVDLCCALQCRVLLLHLKLILLSVPLHAWATNQQQSVMWGGLGEGRGGMPGRPPPPQDTAVNMS